jgi:hypothetical protein
MIKITVPPTKIAKLPFVCFSLNSNPLPLGPCISKVYFRLLAELWTNEDKVPAKSYLLIMRGSESQI